MLHALLLPCATVYPGCRHLLRWHACQITRRPACGDCFVIRASFHTAQLRSALYGSIKQRTSQPVLPCTVRVPPAGAPAQQELAVHLQSDFYGS